MAAPEFTTCVDRTAYEDPGLPPSDPGFFGGIWGLITNGGLDLLLRTCDYMLHGKLVCLGGDQCAIGRVASFETVADKSGLDTIDNDFSINLALCPSPLSGLQTGEAKRKDNHASAVLNKQGSLIAEQTGMPIPRETEPNANKKLSERFTGTFVKIHTILMLANPIPEKIANESESTTWHLPVLHCEIEGNRAGYVCAVANLLLGPIHKTVCKIPIIGGFLCFVLTLVALPFLWMIAGPIAAAWVAGSSDNRDFDGGGDLKADDLVVIRGRWVYDAGHTGWNELHPVKHIQKIPDDAACQWATFDDLRNRWCGETAKIPPTPQDPPTPGSKPQGLTPEQETTWTAQTRPENRWFFHPVVDGCKPEDGGSGPIIH